MCLVLLHPKSLMYSIPSTVSCTNKVVDIVNILLASLVSLLPLASLSLLKYKLRIVFEYAMTDYVIVVSG